MSLEQKGWGLTWWVRKSAKCRGGELSRKEVPMAEQVRNQQALVR
jgi:hypothetical protein